LTQRSPHGDRDDDAFEAVAALEDDQDIAPDDEDRSHGKPTKWQDLYVEYMDFSRSLRTYDCLRLKLVNAERLWVLKALSRAEAQANQKTHRG
jgi:hypothetical protein